MGGHEFVDDFVVGVSGGYVAVEEVFLVPFFGVGVHFCYFQKAEACADYVPDVAIQFFADLEAVLAVHDHEFAFVLYDDDGALFEEVGAGGYVFFDFFDFGFVKGSVAGEEGEEVVVFCDVDFDGAFDVDEGAGGGFYQGVA